MKISKRVSELLSKEDSLFSKGNSSVKDVDGVMVLVYCLLSNVA